MSNRRIRSDAEVHTITSAAVPLGDDIDRRARRYLFQMGLRTLCFLGAVLTFGRVPSWASIAMIVGAVVLPYIAVVLANAGRERPERPEEVLHQRQLAAAAGAGTPWPSSAAGGPAPFPPVVDQPFPTPSAARGSAPFGSDPYGSDPYGSAAAGTADPDRRRHG
ncbi:DUF3099 domain-containing protein [uncultured Cellulomonas sp.]|uniref:DUF3099 domain-containing protein n=1 Tax=uncultured Cellulomonas sp. TaxID=189682 RepID=UPI0026280692|nr:DUF3099 domain-containing protein [uncultured Cellulomonas sp.]